MSDIAHLHSWRLRALVDHCHYQQVVETCEDCGESRSVFQTRDFTDGTQLAFANRDCAICHERVRAAGQADHWSATL